MSFYQSKSVTKDDKSFFYKVQYTTGDSEDTRTKVSKKYATREEDMQAEHDFLIWIVDYKDVPVDMTFQELYDKFLEDRKQAAEEIKKYVHWYNNEHIQNNLGYLSPVQYRLKYLN